MSLFNDYIAAVYTKLNTTTGLIGLVSEKLSNEGAWPKIWLEDGGADDWSNKDNDGLEAIINLHIGSRYDGTKEVRLLMDKVHDALMNAPLVLANSQEVLCQFLRHDIVIDSDGQTRHAVMKFRLLISEV